MAYTKTIYVNGGNPPINATNLNKNEDQLKFLSDKYDALVIAGNAHKNIKLNSSSNALELAASLQSLIAAAGDLIYGSAGNTPAKLAKGTAGQVLTMNSGATAPEWATPVKTATGNYSGDGTYPRTINIGFTPKLLFVRVGGYAVVNLAGTSLAPLTLSSGAEVGTGNIYVAENGFSCNYTTYANESGATYMWIAVG